MERVGWHLDDVPQPFLTFRRIAFGAIILVMVGAAACGVLLAYDGIEGRSLVLPLVLIAVVAGVAVLAGGVFGWTNKKSARWREWRQSMRTLTPGWPTSPEQ